MELGNSTEGLITLPTFQYESVPVSDLKVNASWDDKGRLNVRDITFGGKKVQPTQRFWDSLCSRFGFGPSIFRFFKHEEVFTRISETVGDDQVKLTIQSSPAQDESIDPKDGFVPKLMAVSNPKKPMIHDDEVKNVLNQLGATEIDYRDGIILSKHDLRQQINWDIGGDKHTAKFTLETPIDGYGRPNIFLSLLREVCSNGMVAYGKAFQSGIILGGQNAAAETLSRAMQAYNNEDGFIALKQRIESSQRSFASVHECVSLAKKMWRLGDSDFKTSFRKKTPELQGDKGAMRNRLLTKLYEKTGDLRAIYGVAQIESISEKRMRQLPSKARLYDLICFATEVATHQVKPEAARELHGYVGSLVSNDIFDLEGSGEEFDTFEAFVDENTAKQAEMN